MGQRLDRYGSEFGAFLAPVGSQYAQRAIPPQSLDNTAVPAACNHAVYKVLRDFTVDGGPVAPAFGQPGGGYQSMLVGAPSPAPPSASTSARSSTTAASSAAPFVTSRPSVC